MVLVTTTKSKQEIEGSGLLRYIGRGESEPFRGRGGASIPAKRHHVEVTGHIGTPSLFHQHLRYIGWK